MSISDDVNTLRLSALDVGHHEGLGHSAVLQCNALVTLTAVYKF